MQSDSNASEPALTHEILTDRSVAIKMVGVGGAGSNAIDRLKMDNLERLQLAVINTDLQALSSSPVQDKVLIGGQVTRGLGTGGEPELGRQAAEADREKIAAVVKGCDLVFLLAGLGGGTGGGAAPDRRRGGDQAGGAGHRVCHDALQFRRRQAAEAGGGRPGGVAAARVMR